MDGLIGGMWIAHALKVPDQDASGKGFVGGYLSPVADILLGMNQSPPRGSFTASAVLPGTIDLPQTGEKVDLDRGWNVVVWNDPVNLMSYVVLVFRKVFGYSEEKATRLMLEVHHEGRSVVNTAPREKAEIDCYTLHRHALWATIERA